jgi:hypothetical protein
MEPLASIRSDGALLFLKEFTEELKNANGKSYIYKNRAVPSTTEN